MLGLEHTKERNLDEGVFDEGGRFRQTGWPKHVKPRMMTLMDVIEERGFKAEPVGWLGYPSGKAPSYIISQWLPSRNLDREQPNLFIAAKGGKYGTARNRWIDRAEVDNSAPQ